jgi:peptidoglycan/LPS O-acetylase OafA/YrhL
MTVSATTSRAMIHPLTGVRGIAALWVVLHHLVTTWVIAIPPTAHWLSALADSGYLGVDLFFVLSGFVISYSRFVHFYDGFTESTASSV